MINESEKQNGRCLNCHWWFKVDDSQFGDCVWHNGTKKTVAAKLRFTGMLKTQSDFGCVCWEEDRREKKETDD